eukprot:scaffold207774_cov15-Tisochrysis_lutea.AAC.1
MAVHTFSRGDAQSIACPSLINAGHVSDPSVYVVTPADLNKNYFPFAYEEGARVHSDSWGSTQSAYDSLASEVDRFLWENQDFTSELELHCPRLVPPCQVSRGANPTF